MIEANLVDCEANVKCRTRTKKSYEICSSFIAQTIVFLRYKQAEAFGQVLDYTGKSRLSFVYSMI